MSIKLNVISDNVIKISACLASPLSRYPSSVSDIADRIDKINKERQERITVIKNEAADKNAENKWIDSYDGADHDRGVPWAWRCTPHEAWLEDIENRIRSVNKYCDKQIDLLNKEVDIAKQNYERLLKSYDYYEIQPHVKSLEQIQYNQMLYEASKQYGKPLIAGTDTHSINQYKRIILIVFDYTIEVHFCM